MILDDSTHTLKITTSSTSVIKFDAQIVQHENTSGQGTASSAQTTISTATTTTAITGSASFKTQVKNFTLTNTGSANNTITIFKEVSAVTYQKYVAAILAPGESIFYSDASGFSRLDSSGRPSLVTASSGINGTSLAVLKVGSVKEAAGIFYSYSKDTGVPGLWSAGTPGLAGRATDGTQAADAGALNKPDPGAGNRWYLTGANLIGVAANESVEVVDYLWVNSGIVVNTTTAQTINSVALPARDLNESTAGEDVFAALLVTTATTNAGAFTNMTLSYTNSAGVAGRTATIANYPATAVAGTVIYFLLQAGDSGVQSIQSITLGTSLVGGAVSLIMLRKIVTMAALQSGAVNAPVPAEGIKLANKHCLIIQGVLGGTTANTITGTLILLEKAA